MYNSDRKPSGYLAYFIVAAGFIIAGLVNSTAYAAGLLPGGFYCENASGNEVRCAATFARSALPSINWEGESGAACHLIIDGNQRASGASGRYQVRPVDAVDGVNSAELDCGAGTERVSFSFRVKGPDICPRRPIYHRSPNRREITQALERMFNPGGRGHE